ncbi:MAG: hypothetical protein IPP08_04385 [Chlorobiota bacterium]|nr:hypothetical protein [Chlorobiota bacterium]QQS67408.1 MAG: hypothetical protein IPP08_04385 [Chlorobiota bacterium]
MSEIKNKINIEDTKGEQILFEQYSIILKTWKLVLLISVLSTIATAYYVINVMPIEFMAQVVALPPNKSGTPLDNLLGGLSSSLKDFGLSKLVGKSGSESGYSKIALMNSRTVLDSLTKKYKLRELYENVYKVKKGRIDLFYEALLDNIKIEVSTDGPIAVSVYDIDPVRASNMANDIVKISNHLLRELNRRETEPITLYIAQRYDSVTRKQNILRNSLEQLMRKNKLYDPEKQGTVIGAAVMEVQANYLSQKVIVEALTSQLGDDDPKTIQAKEILKKYDKETKNFAEGKGSSIAGPNLNNMSKSMVDYLQVRQEYEVNAKVLALLEPMFEQSKFDEARDIPSLNILDEAIPPPYKARPKRALIIVSGFLGSIIISYIIIALIAFIKNFNKRYKDSIS